MFISFSYCSFLCLSVSTWPVLGGWVPPYELKFLLTVPSDLAVFYFLKGFLVLNPSDVTDLSSLSGHEQQQQQQQPENEAERLTSTLDLVTVLQVMNKTWQL